MANQKLNGLESFTFPQVSQKNRVESGARTYLKNVETGDIEETKESDIPISFLPPLDWDEDFSVEGEEDKKEKSEFEEMQMKVWQLEYGNSLEIANTQGSGIRLSEGAVAQYQNSINEAKDVQGYDRKQREIQAHEQKHSSVSQEYTDSYGHTTKVYEGYYANLDRNIRDKEEYLRYHTINSAKKSASEEILGLDLTNFKYDNKKIKYPTLDTSLFTEEQQEILDLLDTLNIPEEEVTA